MYKAVMIKDKPTSKNEAVHVLEDGLEEPNFIEERKNKTSAGEFIVKNALEYIDKHYSTRLTLKEVAENTYVSQWHLSKLLNSYTGQSFSELLNHVRIERAKQLLREPSLKIGTIAEKVGFMDLARFSKVFKKMVGISANEYRNKQTL